MDTTKQIPWQLLAEGSVKHVGENYIEVEIVGSLRVRYEPSGGLSVSDYEFLGIDLEDALEVVVTPSPSWHHDKKALPPPAFGYGPLHGNQRQVTKALFPKCSRIDTRQLQRKALAGASIWVRKLHRTLYEVWFRHEDAYRRASQIASSYPK